MVTSCGFLLILARPLAMLTVDEAERIGIDWRSGRYQMIVVGDGSYIPTFFHDLPSKSVLADYCSDRFL